jgi:hypothetical protein
LFGNCDVSDVSQNTPSLSLSSLSSLGLSLFENDLEHAENDAYFVIPYHIYYDMKILRDR